MDIKNVFLYGHLDEELYMEVPPELNLTSSFPLHANWENPYMASNKHPRAWYVKLSSKLLVDGYKVWNIDHSLFIALTKNEICIIYIYVCVCVDDIILMGSNGIFIAKIKKVLNTFFEIKRYRTDEILSWSGNYKIKRTLS